MLGVTAIDVSRSKYRNINIYELPSYFFKVTEKFFCLGKYEGMLANDISFYYKTI